jgi:hypothetical protein
MHLSLVPTPSLSEAVKARLALYKARRKAFVAALPFFPPAFPNAEAMRSRMARTVDNDVVEAGASMLTYPEPVARLRDELLFWVGFYKEVAQEEADEVVARWNTNCLTAWGKALDLLDQGEPAEAFGMVAVMEKHPDLYGPVPDPLNLTGPRWLDLPPAFLPPGHLFSDEQPDTGGV